MTANPDITESLQQLKGQKAWGLRRSHGSMFLFDIGNPIPSVSRRIRGEWGFLFESCNWNFKDLLDHQGISSGDDLNLIESAFDSMQLGDVDKAKFSVDSSVLSLTFSSGFLLTVFPCETEEDAEATEWLLFIPGELVWAKTKSALTRGSIHAA